MDPLMEESLYQWLLNQYEKNNFKGVNRKIVRDKAYELSKNKDKFKASKGWLEKFLRRFKCKMLVTGDSNSNTNQLINENGTNKLENEDEKKNPTSYDFEEMRGRGKFR